MNPGRAVIADAARATGESLGDDHLVTTVGARQMKGNITHAEESKMRLKSRARGFTSTLQFRPSTGITPQLIPVDGDYPSPLTPHTPEELIRALAKIFATTDGPAVGLKPEIVGDVAARGVIDGPNWDDPSFTRRGLLVVGWCSYERPGLRADDVTVMRARPKETTLQWTPVRVRRSGGTSVANRRSREI